METIILYKSDFKNEVLWDGIIKCAGLPEDTEEIEITPRKVESLDTPTIKGGAK